MKRATSGGFFLDILIISVKPMAPFPHIPIMRSNIHVINLRILYLPLLCYKDMYDLGRHRQHMHDHPLYSYLSLFRSEFQIHFVKECRKKSKKCLEKS